MWDFGDFVIVLSRILKNITIALEYISGFLFLFKNFWETESCFPFLYSIGVSKILKIILDSYLVGSRQYSIMVYNF